MVAKMIAGAAWIRVDASSDVDTPVAPFESKKRPWQFVQNVKQSMDLTTTNVRCNTTESASAMPHAFRLSFQELHVAVAHARTSQRWLPALELSIKAVDDDLCLPVFGLHSIPIKVIDIGMHCPLGRCIAN